MVTKKEPCKHKHLYITYWNATACSDCGRIIVSAHGEILINGEG